MNKIEVRESENKVGKAEDPPAAQRQTTVQPDMSGFLRLQCLPPCRGSTTWGHLPEPSGKKESWKYNQPHPPLLRVAMWESPTLISRESQGIAGESNHWGLQEYSNHWESDCEGEWGGACPN